MVSSECDFVSICKLSSLSPFLCRQHRSTFIQEKLHKEDFTFSRRWTFCVRHWCRLFQGVQPNCQNPSAMFSTYIMRERQGIPGRRPYRCLALEQQTPLCLCSALAACGEEVVLVLELVGALLQHYIQPSLTRLQCSCSPLGTHR